MQKTDYDRIVFLILRILYTNMQEGKATTPNDISAERFDINEPYWTDVLRELQKDELIDGVKVVRDIYGEERIRGLAKIKITSKGIHYIKEGPRMNGVYKILKEAKEWIPGLGLF